MVFKTERVTHSTRLLYFLLTIGVFFANLHLAEKERPELLTKIIRPSHACQNLGLYTHQVYDLTLQVKAGSQKALADSSKLQETENYVKANQSEPNPNMFAERKT